MASDAPGVRRLTVFLSYARADRARIAVLAAALEKRGVTVWWDAHINAGAAFAKTIEAELEKADAVVVAWSQASLGSDWVHDEAGRGRDMQKLVPISLDGTEAPLGFRQYHVTNFAGWNGNDRAPEIEQLLRGIVAAGDPEKSTPRKADTLSTPTALEASNRRSVLLAGGGAVVVAVSGFAAWQFSQKNADVKNNSVAVLPFKNLSGDPAQDYFSDGLAEEVRSTLARNNLLQVIAPASSARFRESKDDAKTIAAKLGVAFLLGGSVRRSGNVVRIAADLIDGKTGFSSWAQSFDRPMLDIFAVQSEIATTVVRALSAKMQNADGVAKSAGGTNNVAAFDAYLRGRALYDAAGNEEEEKAALARFDAAIALDPQYAAAHAARSRSLAAIANGYAKPDELALTYAKSIAAAERASTLAPDSADSQSALAYAILNGRLNVIQARAPFEKSNQLGKGEASVMARFARYCSAVGRKAEATTAIQRAMILDPLNPQILRAAGAIRFAARDYSAAISLTRKALGLNPKLSSAHAIIGDSLMLSGEMKSARIAYNSEPNDLFKLQGLAILEFKENKKTQAKKAMATLTATIGNSGLYQQAQVLAQWQELDSAIETLTRAYNFGDSGLLFARNDPFLDPLRARRQFATILKKIGFESYSKQRSRKFWQQQG
jgi:TolB-like protein